MSVAVIVTRFVSPGRMRPNDTVGWSNVSCGLTSRAALTRPAAVFRERGDVPLEVERHLRLAVLSSALFTSAGVHDGWSAFVSAASAVTCGEAIDVPLTCSKSPAGSTAPVVSFTTDERTLEPGAAMSGLIPIVGPGPRLLEAATTSGQPEVSRFSGPSMSTVGLGFALAQATSARPSAWVTITPGIAGSVMPPIEIGASGPLLWTM